MNQVTTFSNDWAWWFPIIEAGLFFIAGALWARIRRYVRHPEDQLIRRSPPPPPRRDATTSSKEV